MPEAEVLATKLSKSPSKIVSSPPPQVGLEENYSTLAIEPTSKINKIEVHNVFITFLYYIC
jgi:hypothetical protein